MEIVGRDDYIRSRVLCRADLSIPSQVIKRLKRATKKTFETSCFGVFSSITKMAFQGQLFLHLLFKQDISQAGDKMLFHVNRSVAEFRPNEFTLITGLQFGPKPVIPQSSRFHKEIWGNKRNLFVTDIKKTFMDATKRESRCEKETQLKLGLLWILYGMLLVKDNTSKRIDIQYIHLMDDLDVFNKFPWGRVAYDFLITDMRKLMGYTATKRRERKWAKGVNKKEKVHLDLFGFAYALQFWAYEVIPCVAKLCATRKSDSSMPRMLRWKSQDQLFRFDELTEKCFPVLRPGDEVGQRFSVLSNMKPSKAEEKEGYYNSLVTWDKASEASSSKGLKRPRADFRGEKKTNKPHGKKISSKKTSAKVKCGSHCLRAKLQNIEQNQVIILANQRLIMEKMGCSVDETKEEAVLSTEEEDFDTEEEDFDSEEEEETDFDNEEEEADLDTVINVDFEAEHDENQEGNGMKKAHTECGVDGETKIHFEGVETEIDDESEKDRGTTDIEAEVEHVDDESEKNRGTTDIEAEVEHVDDESKKDRGTTDIEAEVEHVVEQSEKERGTTDIEVEVEHVVEQSDFIDVLGKEPVDAGAGPTDFDDDMLRRVEEVVSEMAEIERIEKENEQQKWALIVHNSSHPLTDSSFLLDIKYDPLNFPPRHTSERAFKIWYVCTKGRADTIRLSVQNIAAADHVFFKFIWELNGWLDDKNIDALFNLVILKAKRWPKLFRSGWTIVDMFFWDLMTNRLDNDMLMAKRSKTTWCWATHGWKVSQYVSGTLPLHGQGQAWVDVDVVYGVGHVNNDHWVLYELRLKDEEIVIYDTWGGTGRRNNPKTMSKFRKMAGLMPSVCTELMLGKDGDGKKMKGHKKWKVSMCKHVPQQNNGASCGILACKMFECMVAGCSIELVDPDKVGEYRKHYCLELFDEDNIIVGW